MKIFFPWERLPGLSVCRFRPPGLTLAEQAVEKVDDQENAQGEDQKFEHNEEKGYDYYSERHSDRHP